MSFQKYQKNSGKFCLTFWWKLALDSWQHQVRSVTVLPQIGTYTKKVITASTEKLIKTASIKILTSLCSGGEKTLKF